MPDSLYDEHAEFYERFITRGLSRETSHFSLAVTALCGALGDIGGKRVLDLACGEGHLARVLTDLGGKVTGVDLSEALLAAARSKSGGREIQYLKDDAMNLQGVASCSFEAVVCNLALMDIPDIERVFVAVGRVLVPGGLFTFNILHPCFETPFSLPESILELGDSGEFVACRVSRYAEEGHWTSGGSGMRGTVGAQHRKLSTYLNALLASGFALLRLDEPMLKPGDHETTEDQRLSRVPVSLVVSARFEAAE